MAWKNEKANQDKKNGLQNHWILSTECTEEIDIGKKWSQWNIYFSKIVNNCIDRMATTGYWVQTLNHYYSE